MVRVRPHLVVASPPLYTFPKARHWRQHKARSLNQAEHSVNTDTSDTSGLEKEQTNQSEPSGGTMLTLLSIS